MALIEMLRTYVVVAVHTTTYCKKIAGVREDIFGVAKKEFYTNISSGNTSNVSMNITV